MLGWFVITLPIPTCLYDAQGALTLADCKPLGLGLEAWAILSGLSGLSLLTIIECVFAPLRGAGVYVFALYQRWRSLGRISPASGNRISVLLIRLQGDDVNQTFKQSILDTMRRELGDAIEIITWPLNIPNRDGHTADNERLIFSRIQKWLRITSCDVAVWGRVKPNDVLSLRFAVPEFGTRLPENYTLTDEFELPRKFIQTVGLAIVMQVWNARPKPELVDYLIGSVSRLQFIIETEAFDDEVKAALILTYGRALLTIGEKQNSADQIRRAIDTYKTALQLFTPARSLQIWKAISIELATSLCKFGRRYDLHSYEEAEAIYRDVLQRIDPVVDPLGWGAVACDFGNALAQIGNHGTNSNKLNDAITVLKGSAKICSRERAPFIWACIMCNAGIASVFLGERQTEPDSLLDAVEYFEQAMKEWTRAQYPFAWASVQSLLANAYRLLGERRTQRDDLVMAITCGRNSLKEIRRVNEPIRWAHCQTNLGISHLALAELAGSVTEANRALKSIRLASTELRPEVSPSGFIMSQINLGHALLVKGVLGKSSNTIWAAVDACNRGMRSSIGLDAVLPEAAMLTNNLGSAHGHLGSMLGRTESFEEAFFSHSLAIKIYTATHATYYVRRTNQYVAAVLSNIGMTSTSAGSTRRWLELLSTIAGLGSVSTEQEKRALTKKLSKLAKDRMMTGDCKFLAFCRFHLGHQQRLRAEFTGNRVELDEAKQNVLEAARLWGATNRLALARTQYELGAIYLREAERGSREPLNEALLSLRAAIAGRERRKVPRDWAAAKVNLTSVYGVLSESSPTWKAMYYCSRAIRNCDQALEVLSAAETPTPWALAHNNRSTAYLRLGHLLHSGNILVRIAIRFLFGVPDESAARSLLEALTVYLPDREPPNWAMAKLNLSSAYLLRGLRQENSGALRQAIALADEAATAFTRRVAPLRWAECLAQRANGLAVLGKRERSATLLRDTIAAYRLASDVFRAKGANAYLVRATSGLEEAEECLKQLSDTSKTEE